MSQNVTKLKKNGWTDERTDKGKSKCASFLEWGNRIPHKSSALHVETTATGNK